MCVCVIKALERSISRQIHPSVNLCLPSALHTAQSQRTRDLALSDTGKWTNARRANPRCKQAVPKLAEHRRLGKSKITAQWRCRSLASRWMRRWARRCGSTCTACLSCLCLQPPEMVTVKSCSPPGTAQIKFESRSHLHQESPDS